jgi:hypothetical protein
LLGFCDDAFGFSFWVDTVISRKGAKLKRRKGDERNYTPRRKTKKTQKEIPI